MLKNLHIRNYALIEHLEIQPTGGLNVITGETGAGKSILLGAVGLLLGNRADTSVLFDSENKCIIEGTFGIGAYELRDFFQREELDYDEETIIRREINPAGKSRAFINDTPVRLDTLKSLGSRLMDIHSQHESLLLGKSNFQLTLLDSYAGCMDSRKTYQETFARLRKEEKILAGLKEEKENLEKEADYQQFIFDELYKADLSEGEQETLENELQVLENAEEIKTSLNEAAYLLTDGEAPALGAIRQVKSLLQNIMRYGEQYRELFERLNSALIELDDLNAELQRAGENVEFDPEKTETMQSRLSLIYQLEKKHHVGSVKELLDIRDRLEQDTLHYHDLDSSIERSAEACRKLREEAQNQSQTLSKKRSLSVPALEEEMTALLKKVGIPEAAFRVRVVQGELNPYGQDSVDLLFSANKGVAPQPLMKVASGGEFSRLMFCIKRILAEKISLPTIIFDEIDTGVSGEIALKMGEMMKFMASRHQLITISHLPQMAARADKHYFVYKETGPKASISKIRVLSPQERIEEIAKMIGGNTPSSHARESAKELINL